MMTRTASIDPAYQKTGKTSSLPLSTYDLQGLLNVIASPCQSLLHRLSYIQVLACTAHTYGSCTSSSFHEGCHISQSIVRLKRLLDLASYRKKIMFIRSFPSSSYTNLSVSSALRQKSMLINANRLHRTGERPETLVSTSASCLYNCL